MWVLRRFCEELNLFCLNEGYKRRADCTVAGNLSAKTLLFNMFPSKLSC